MAVTLQCIQSITLHFHSSDRLQLLARLCTFALNAVSVVSSGIPLHHQLLQALCSISRPDAQSYPKHVQHDMHTYIRPYKCT